MQVRHQPNDDATITFSCELITFLSDLTLVG